MQVMLHANATTTPKQRAYIQASTASVAALVAELGVSERTVRRWKGRTAVTDRSHRPKRLQTRFDAVEEEIVRELRTRLGLSLDDITGVMRRGVRPDISRSALHRCLQRLGLSRRPKPDKPTIGTFDPTPFGYVHVDLKHLTRLQGQPAYVFVAIERTTSFVHVEIIEKRDGETVAGCFEHFLDAFGYPVHTVLTDNGSEFTDRFGAASYEVRTKGTGRHPFDIVCSKRGIRHRLSRPYHPQTNGKVERFNRRIGEALASAPASGNNGKNRFADHASRNTFIHAFIDAYNRTRLRSLNYNAPIQALYNLQGHNTKAGTSTE
jgi:transposase